MCEEQRSSSNRQERGKHADRFVPCVLHPSTPAEDGVPGEVLPVHSEPLVRLGLGVILRIHLWSGLGRAQLLVALLTRSDRGSRIPTAAASRWQNEARSKRPRRLWWRLNSRRLVQVQKRWALTAGWIAMQRRFALALTSYCLCTVWRVVACVVLWEIGYVCASRNGPSTLILLQGKHICRAANILTRSLTGAVCVAPVIALRVAFTGGALS